MHKINDVLSSPSQYKQAFEDGISVILQTGTAGTFILACANLYQHPSLLEKNHEELNHVFGKIKDYYNNCECKGLQPDGAHDDIEVMRKIIELGLDNLDPIQQQELASESVPLLLSYNQLRSLRPSRMSSTKDFRLNTQFNENGFHFDKAFLKKETFAEGEYNGRQISLLYNKFPFITYHALLVLDKSLHRPQYLTEADLDYIFNLQQSIEINIPGLTIAYNSIGAGASVNHLHFQVFIADTPLPIFSPELSHNGGSRTYPAAHKIFCDPESCWSYIESLHECNIAYNLIFHDGEIYCFKRKTSSNTKSRLNPSGFIWSEMAGSFIVNNKESYTELNADALIEALKSVTG